MAGELDTNPKSPYYGQLNKPTTNYQPAPGPVDPYYTTGGPGGVKAPQERPAPAVVTSDAAKTELTTAKQTSDKTTMDMANQQQLNAQKDAQTKVDAQVAADQKSKEGDQTDTSKLADAANSLSMKSDGELTQMLTGGDATKSYYTKDGQVIDANSGNPVGSIDDVRAGKITADTLGNKSAVTDTSGQGVIDQERQAVLDNEKKLSDAYDKMNNTMNGIQNGSIPLTPDQQAQIDATKQMFEQSRQAQLQANKNFTGGTTQLGITQGINKYSPGLAMGEIQDSVDKGILKIAKLDAQQAQALGKLRLSFTTSNIKLAQDAYTEYQKLITDKNTELNKISDAAQAHLDKMQQYNLDIQKFQQQQTQDNFKNTLDAANLGLTQKKDAFNQYIQQANLTEKQKTDAFDQWYKTRDLAIKEQANQAGQGLQVTPVNMTGNGLPNKASQATFLNALNNPELATTIKAIAEYRQNPNSIPTRNFKGMSGLTQQQVLSLVNQYDPTWTQGNYAARSALLQNFASGKYSQNVNSLNTVIGHIADLQKNFEQIHNVGFTPYNAAKNAVINTFGGGAIGKGALDISAAVEELANTFKGAAATETGIENLGKIDSNSSPDQVKQFVEGAIELMASRLNSLGETYQSGMGKPKDGGFLSPTSQKTLLELQQKGLDINVPELADSPLVKIQTFHDSSPDNAKILDTVHRIAPNATPQETEDKLAQQGINL